jgi:hypothetical protein
MHVLSLSTALGAGGLADLPDPWVDSEPERQLETHLRADCIPGRALKVVSLTLILLKTRQLRSQKAIKGRKSGFSGTILHYLDLSY